MLGGEPDEALRQASSRADGQPFLLTELLRGLRTENLVTVDDSTAKLAAGAQLPRRLVDWITGQLARPPRPPGTPWRWPPCSGASFSLDELAGLLEQAAADICGVRYGKRSPRGC